MNKFSTDEGKDFANAITKLRNAEEVTNFFSDMFTPAEAEAFIGRWQAAQMLHAGEPYVDIQKKTGLSSATVARVSQALQFGTGGYKKLLERLSRKK